MKKYHLLQLLIIICIPVFATQCVDDKPIDTDESSVNLFINELLSTGSPDWLEIYNPTDNEIDMAGFFIYDEGTASDKYQLPAGTTIPAKGFLIILCDDEGTGLHTNFKLSSGGETVTLEDKDEKTIDAVVLPALDDGESYGRETDGADNWEIYPVPTPAASNAEATTNPPPVIENVSFTPSPPTNQDDVSVTAVVTDNSSVATVSLHYFIDDKETTIDMTGEGNTYTTVISKQTTDTEVYFYIVAVDDEDGDSMYPDDAPTTKVNYLVGAPELKLFINEFMADNETTLEDPDAAGEFDDWIEVYNAGTSPVDIGGMYITDDLGELDMYQIPTTNPSATTIPAGGFLVLIADKDTEQGILHVNIKLGAGGEAIGLTKSDGITIIDQIEFGAQTVDVSFGRKPDGTVNWTSFETPTPGATNNDK